MNITEILKKGSEMQASDIFIVSGQPVSYKKAGVITRNPGPMLTKDDCRSLVDEIYRLADAEDRGKQGYSDDDFAISIPSVGRFRVNIYKQRGSWSAVLRLVAFELKPIEQMGIPKSILEFGEFNKGMVIVTGPAGSGKSTTLSYIIDYINETRNCHILTLEDPIEFLHKHKQSIVSQREVSIDTESYKVALRAAMREAPDVIFVGEMRDYETIETAVTAAETGHLVLSTLHTVGCANTIGRIIDVFPANQQQQIKTQLAMVLKAVISQQLLPTKDGGVAPAIEILKVNNAIGTMIRDGKVHQIDSAIYAGAAEGMISMDASIADLYRKGEIDKETAFAYCLNQDVMKRNLSR